MEKWPWQMARLMFNKDVTAYTYTLGYTFLTPIWGPSAQIRFFFLIFETIYFFTSINTPLLIEDT